MHHTVNSCIQTVHKSCTFQKASTNFRGFSHEIGCSVITTTLGFCLYDQIFVVIKARFLNVLYRWSPMFSRWNALPDTHCSTNSIVAMKKRSSSHDTNSKTILGVLPPQYEGQLGSQFRQMKCRWSHTLQNQTCQSLTATQEGMCCWDV